MTIDQLPRPSDLACRWGDCWSGDEDYSFPLVLRGPRTPPRATLQRHAAAEWGVDFQDVRVLARFARILTRQEVWDEWGKEYWEDDWMDRNGVGYYFRSTDLRGKVPEGYYRDDEYDAARERGELPTPLAVPDAPAEPPPTWVPREEWPTWELCKPDAEGARAVFVTEITN